MKTIRTEDAQGTILCQDITQIIRGVTKDARFRKGHIVKKEDIEVLLSMGKEHLYVWEDIPGMIHESDAAQRLLKLCQNEYMHPTPVKEGKIELIADEDGLFTVESKRLIEVNSIGSILISTRHGNTAVKKGDKIAAFKVVPLVIKETLLIEAEKKAGNKPLLSLHPWKIKKTALIITGSEIYKGRIKDTFTPVIEQKLKEFGASVDYHEICDDKRELITAAIFRAKKAGAEMILCTGGMSVDPDDRTPGALKATGADIITYGSPILPGAMFLVGYFFKENNTDTQKNDEELQEGTIPIVGVPGCAMFASKTVFDVFLPRLMAQRRIYKKDIVASGEGGLCLSCKVCTFPNCGFGKGVAL